ncbi:HNH endonuclease [Xanthomonas campestris]|uniref:HNH endonuclease n=1 Tax=Xanthomonas campestris TaxID=339 RepID=UPI000E0FF4C1|nr:HNH endonuclease [Xanthomonas campestris]
MQNSYRPEELDAALAKLIVALARVRSVKYCHSLWSKFVRMRDGSRCVACHEKSDISAHHIMRKSFIEEARYEPGNGITLCRACHADVHRQFNRKPDPVLPMDAEGGENIERMVELIGLLASDAEERGILSDQYYYLSDNYLRACKNFQSIDADIDFPGTRLEQAYWIWRQTPRSMLRALKQANGFDLPRNFIQLGPVSIFRED